MIENIETVQKKLQDKIEVRKLASTLKIGFKRVFDLEGVQYQTIPDSASSVVDISRGYFDDDLIDANGHEIQTP